MVFNKVNLKNEELDFIENFVLQEWIELYKQPCQTDIDPPDQVKDRAGNSYFFSHALMRKNNSPNMNGEVNSNHYPMFESIFLRWLEENNFDKPKHIYRACINVTTYLDKEFSVPHYDHSWPHYNWIWYLNDTDAGTLLFDEDFNITKEFPSTKNYACAFENTLHAQQFPKPDQLRYVVVFTFI